MAQRDHCVGVQTAAMRDSLAVTETQCAPHGKDRNLRSSAVSWDMLRVTFDPGLKIGPPVPLCEGTVRSVRVRHALPRPGDRPAVNTMSHSAAVRTGNLYQGSNIGTTLSVPPTPSHTDPTHSV